MTSVEPGDLKTYSDAKPRVIAIVIERVQTATLDIASQLWSCGELEERFSGLVSDSSTCSVTKCES